MLKYFRVKSQPEKVVISVSLLESDANLPFTIRQLNNLPEAIRRRVYRGFIPPALLTRFGIIPTVDLHIAGREQYDDITLLAVQRKA